MDDVAEKAAHAVDFLERLQVDLNELLMNMDSLNSLGKMTPEIEAQIVAQVNQLRLYLMVLRESVDPAGAPLLSIKRWAKQSTREMIASGMSEVEIRSAIGGAIVFTARPLTEEQRSLLVPLVDAAIGEALSDAGSSSS
jgi:hypothetical protein